MEEEKIQFEKEKEIKQKGEKFETELKEGNDNMLILLRFPEG